VQVEEAAHQVPKVLRRNGHGKARRQSCEHAVATTIDFSTGAAAGMNATAATALGHRHTGQELVWGFETHARAKNIELQNQRYVVALKIVEDFEENDNVSVVETPVDAYLGL
jgi:hypothetical protein